MSSSKRMYAEIAKTEAQPDGTIKVWGYASSGVKDDDGEIITPEALKAALPDYMKFGAVREMHQPSAAGTAIEAYVEEDTGKTWFGAHVVDPIAVKKVETNVYKGFSIGGKVTERDKLNKSVIKGVKLVEVSLVDRPANPDAVFTMYKAARTPEDDVNELAELLDAGAVTPGDVLALVKAAKNSVVVINKSADGETTLSSATPKGEASAGASSMPDAPAQTTDDVKKGMSTLSSMAGILESLGYLCSSAEWEAQYEQDGSGVPAALRAWLSDGAKIFSSMAAEELAELQASLAAQVQAGNGAADVAIMRGAKGEDLLKVGARFSKATKAALSKVHSACKEAAAHLDALDYNSDSAKAADTDGIGSGDNPITKTQVEANVLEAGLVEELVNKAVASAIQPINDALAKANKEKDELKARLEEISKRAAPGKALLKALVINKSDDTATPDDPALKAVAPPPEGTPERAEYEMRKVYQQGGRRLAG